ncbi:MAG: (Fe-S)-binding protein, partial [Archangium sp.]|nr:(Fe-S)-binding protein [Archangium sp.]
MNPIFTGLLVLVGVGFFTKTMLGRLRAMASLKAEPGNRLDRKGDRLKALAIFGFGQKRMVDPEEFVPGFMHVLIFSAFVVLALRTVMLFVMGFSSSALSVLSNLSDPFWTDYAALKTPYAAYLFLKDLVAAGALIGVSYFGFLRLVVKPDRLTKSNEALLILGFIGTLMISEFIFGASHLREQGIDFSSWEPVTSLVGKLLGPVPTDTLHTLGVVS